MKIRKPIIQVAFALLVFAPVALVPATGSGALLSSQNSPGELSGTRLIPAECHSLIQALRARGLVGERGEAGLNSLTRAEANQLAKGALPILTGRGEKSPLVSNETAAIVLTLIIIGCVVGFVETTR